MTAIPLAGAEYGVYTDSNCSNKVATLTTNASGNANTVSLNPGRYYVKETKAPKGYFTDSQVYTADVSGANRESLACEALSQRQSRK